MCGLEVRERFPGSGSPGALLGLLGQLGAAVAGCVPPSSRACQLIVCIVLFISHRIATRRYPLTLVYGAYGGWDGVLGVLFGASVLVSRRAFCTQTPICFGIHAAQATSAALRAGDGGLRVVAAPRRERRPAARGEGEEGRVTRRAGAGRE